MTLHVALITAHLKQRIVHPVMMNSTSSDESDSEQQRDKSKPVLADSVKVLIDKEKLSLLILSYIAKFKLSASASVDLLDLLKIIAPDTK